MIHIDGARGEGGGQVLRSSLTLSILTGRAFRMVNIRAKRPKPGLRPQHLAAVQAAATISQAHTDGVSPGSSTLRFQPEGVHPGSYQFDISTAGSTSLVLQTIFLPLAMAGAPSSVTITGGTHVPWSPCFHYLERQWLPWMRQIGFDAQLTLIQAGFYPQGGGRIQARIQPAPTLQPLQLSWRGGLRRLSGISAIANLPDHIANRQRHQVEQRLIDQIPDLGVELVSLPSPGRGSVVYLQVQYDLGSGGFTALGKRGLPAERVADQAVDQLESYLTSDACLDKHLADQLIVPLALGPEPSSFTAAEITHHLLTNVEVVQAFLDVTIRIEGAPGEPGSVHIVPGISPYPSRSHSTCP